MISECQDQNAFKKISSEIRKIKIKRKTDTAVLTSFVTQICVWAKHFVREALGYLSDYLWLITKSFFFQSILNKKYKIMHFNGKSFFKNPKY